MENEGGKIDKWMISMLMTKMIIWTNVIFLKFIFYNSYVDMDRNILNKDNLTMLCEQLPVQNLKYKETKPKLHAPSSRQNQPAQLKCVNTHIVFFSKYCFSGWQV